MCDFPVHIGVTHCILAGLSQDVTILLESFPGMVIHKVYKVNFRGGTARVQVLTGCSGFGEGRGYNWCFEPSQPRRTDYIRAERGRANALFQQQLLSDVYSTMIE